MSEMGAIDGGYLDAVMAKEDAEAMARHQAELDAAVIVFLDCEQRCANVYDCDGSCVAKGRGGDQ